jgi:cellobiose-specific phosphotransferase system component IIB
MKPHILKFNEHKTTTTIIFLDIDGVLRTHKSDSEWSNKLGEPIPAKVFDRNFSPKSVSNINYIIHYTGAKIVVISSWRTNFTIPELKNIFQKQGIQGEVIDKTDIGLTRGEEIQEYLDTNTVDKYVVIDDQLKGITGIIPSKNIVEVDPKIGFESDRLVDNVLDILL